MNLLDVFDLAGVSGVRLHADAKDSPPNNPKRGRNISYKADQFQHASQRTENDEKSARDRTDDGLRVAS